jgi:hypothetical protein
MGSSEPGPWRCFMGNGKQAVLLPLLLEKLVSATGRRGRRWWRLARRSASSGQGSLNARPQPVQPQRDYAGRSAQQQQRHEIEGTDRWSSQSAAEQVETCHKGPV